MVEDVIDCSLNYYKASVNNSTRVVQILEASTFNIELLHKVQNIHNANPLLFSPFHIYNNGRFIYLVLPYAYMNMETAFSRQQKFKEESLQSLANTLLEASSILHANEIIHQMITYL